MKKYVSKEEKDSLYKAFSIAVKDRALFDEFIIDIFTPTEYKEIHTRLQIIELLEKGVKHRDIASKLGIGVGTVNRGALELKNPKGGFKQIIQKLKITK